MAAFNFFGRLVALLRPEEKANKLILQEIDFNIIPLILHLNDESHAVRQSCRNSLETIAQILEIRELMAVLGVAMI